MGDHASAAHYYRANLARLDAEGAPAGSDTVDALLFLAEHCKVRAALVCLLAAWSLLADALQWLQAHSWEAGWGMAVWGACGWPPCLADHSKVQRARPCGQMRPVTVSCLPPPAHARTPLSLPSPRAAPPRPCPLLTPPRTPPGPPWHYHRTPGSTRKPRRCASG